MTTFAGEIGIIGHNHNRERQYFPSLPMINTAELFDHIPEKGSWQYPKPYDRWDIISPTSVQTKWDGWMTEWIHYLDHVKTGFQIGHRTATEGVISVDLESIKAAIYFPRSGLEAKSYEDNIAQIVSVRKAFAALLSKDARKNLDLKPADTHASPEDIQNARTLVRNFERTA